MVDQQKNDGQVLPQLDDSSSAVDPATSQTANSPIPPAPAEDSIIENAEAGDVDIIEKAWIDKAKHIVDQTSSDPFEQQKMISKIKADYIKKRFNKDIKIDSE